MYSGNSPHCHEVINLFHMTDVTSSVVTEIWHTTLIELKIKSVILIEYNKMRSIPPFNKWPVMDGRT